MILAVWEWGVTVQTKVLTCPTRGRLSVLIALVAGALALVVAAPVGATPTREKPAKPPSRLWQELPLGHKLPAQPSRAQRTSPSKRVSQLQRTPVLQTRRATPTRAAQQPNVAPSPPRPKPGPVAPVKKKKHERSTLAFLALLFGYAVVVAVPLVVGGIAVLPRLRRMRRHQLRARSQRGTFASRTRLALHAWGGSWSARTGALRSSRRTALRSSRRTARPFRTLLSTMSNWGHSPIAALARRSEPSSQPMEASVRNAETVTEANLPREGSLGVGDQVGAILAAAEHDAERMRREVHEEVAAIRRQTERILAAGTSELAQELERIRSEALTDAQALREEAEHYAVEHVQSANERAAMVVARARSKAEARRASAEETARLVDEATRRQAALKETADALEQHLRAGVEERLSTAHQGLENLTRGLEEIRGEGEKVPDDGAEDATRARQKTG